MKKTNYRILKQDKSRACALYAFANLLEDNSILEYNNFLTDDGGASEENLVAIAKNEGYKLHTLFYTRSNTDFLTDGDLINSVVEREDQTEPDLYLMLLVGVWGANLNHEISALMSFDDGKIIVLDSLKEYAYICESLRDFCYSYDIMELYVLGVENQVTFRHEDNQYIFNRYLRNDLD